MSGVTWRPYQPAAVQALSRVKRGIVKAPAGSGKTVIGAGAIAEVLRRRPTDRGRPFILWIAGTNDLLRQAEAAIDLFPIIREHSDVSVRFAGGVDPEEFPDPDLVVVDECQHSAAATWKRVIARGKCVWGLSATPEREDGRTHEVFELCGEIVHEIPREEVMASGHLAHGLVHWHETGQAGRFVREAQEAAEAAFQKVRFPRAAYRHGKGFLQMAIQLDIHKGKKCPANLVEHETINDLAPVLVEVWNRCLYREVQRLGVIEDEARHQAVERLARESDPGVLILCPTIDLCKLYGERLGAPTLSGRVSEKRRKKIVGEMRSGEIPIVTATSVADEGLDIPRLSTIILAAASRSSRLAEQRSGRVMRSFEGKEKGVVHDFLGEGHFMLQAQAKARQKIYRKLGYNQILPSDG